MSREALSAALRRSCTPRPAPRRARQQLRPMSQVILHAGRVGFEGAVGIVAALVLAAAALAIVVNALGVAFLN